MDINTLTSSFINAMGDFTDEVSKRTRKAVSGERNRYQKDGYDLDLSYITKRFIGMRICWILNENAGFFFK